MNDLCEFFVTMFLFGAVLATTWFGLVVYSVYTGAL